MPLIFDFDGTSDFAFNNFMPIGGTFVTGTDNGVTFILSPLAGTANPWVLALSGGGTADYLSAQNTTFTGTQSVTLTWGTTPGVNTGLLNPVVTGKFDPGEILFLTTKGGTRIATPAGFSPVEDLRPGDVIRTADGGETTVNWLGEQPVDVRLSHPRKVNPICITAGALAEGVPARDLWVSGDHALCIDRMLINAVALVNGSSIYQVRDMPPDGFTYYHIETSGGHELFLAEGVAAESSIDYAGTDGFVNGDERDGAPIHEMDLPRISDARLVPQALRENIAARDVVLRAA